MHRDAYHRLAQRQEGYWFYLARRELARALFRCYGVKKGARALEIGCGAGGNLSLFREIGSELMVATDVSPIALGLARKVASDALLVQADANNPAPFRDQSFDVIGLFDVLYHSWIKDENRAIKDLVRLLKPGGHLLLIEPAFRFLSRGVDQATMGSRRYTRADMLGLAKRANLETRYIGYFLGFGFPIALGSAMLDRLHRRLKGPDERREYSGVDFRPLSESLNRMLLRAALAEINLIRRGFRLPFGIAIVAILQRPNLNHCVSERKGI